MSLGRPRVGREKLPSLGLAFFNGWYRSIGFENEIQVGSSGRLEWNSGVAAPILPRSIEALSWSCQAEPQVCFFNFARRKKFNFAQAAGSQLQFGIYFQIHGRVNSLAD